MIIVTLAVNQDYMAVDGLGRQQFLHIWYANDSVESTGKTNGIAPVSINNTFLGKVIS